MNDQKTQDQVTAAVVASVDLPVRPLVACPMCGAAEGYTLSDGSTYRWWHDYCAKGEVFFVKGRLKFGGSDNSAPFPNAVVVFRPNVHDALGNCDV